MRARVVALIFFLVFGWTAASADAETWVLWRYNAMVVGRATGANWVIEDTAPTRPECETLLSQAVVKWSSGWEGVQQVTKTGMIYQRGDVLWAMNWKCLPNTAPDPRGPK